MADGTLGLFEEELRQLRQRLSALEADNESLLRGAGERVRAEEALRKQAAFCESLIRTAAEGICVCRAVAGFPFVAFSVWNERMTQLTGYTIEEINRLGWYQSLYPDPRVQARAVERMARMREGDDICREEWTITRKDGDLRTLVMSSRRVETDDGPAVVAVMHDVTERNREFEQRRRLEAKLQHAKQLESLGVLAEGVAHDFNNLLTATLGYASLAGTQVPASSPARGHLLRIEDAARRAADLCQQMLAFAGKGTVVPEPTDLSALVRDAAQLLRASLSKKAILTLELAKDLSPVLADPTQIRQVVMGLVINASEALEDNPGRIGLTTRAETLSRSRLSTLQLGEDLCEGDYALLEVSDTGKGMDEATRTRIFEPFFSTKFTGRGLGLAAVLGIVRRHQGALEVISESGRGSTFRLWIPFAGSVVLSSLGAGQVNQPAAVASGRLLLAEDEEHVRTLASLILREMGFEVVEARDGQEALDHIRADPAGFRLALLDLTMPTLDGLTVARRVRELAPDLPLVLMSGYSVRELAEQARDLAVAACLQKPFSLEALRATMLSALVGASL